MSGTLRVIVSWHLVVKGFIPYAITLVAVSGVAIAQQSPQPIKESPPKQQSQTTTSSSPRRLTINVSVAEPEDLKANEGDRVTVGQLLADRSRERQRLEAQAQQLELTLQRLEIATIKPPQPPAPVPAVAALPDTSYLEEKATIERSKVTVDQAE